MAREWKHEIPRFTAGEPGFVDRLNALADAIQETRAALEETQSSPEPEKPTVKRSRSTKKE